MPIKIGTCTQICAVKLRVIIDFIGYFDWYAPCKVEG